VSDRFAATLLLLTENHGFIRHQSCISTKILVRHVQNTVATTIAANHRRIKSLHSHHHLLLLLHFLYQYQLLLVLQMQLLHQHLLL